MGKQERVSAGKFLTIQLGNVFGAMGLVGNIMNEGGAGLIANRMEKSWKKKTGWDDGWDSTGNHYTKEKDTITPALNNGTYRNYRIDGDGTRRLATFKNDNCRDAFTNDYIGWGIVQWTFSSRKRNLYDFCDKWCKQRAISFDLGNLEMQLDFIIDELFRTYKNTLGILMTTNDILIASNYVCVNYERPQGYETKEVQKTRYLTSINAYSEIFNSKDTQWFEYKNNWYYLQKGLVLKDKWLQYKDTWYHLDSNGCMQKNCWIKYADDWYYLLNDGSMATNQYITWQDKEYYLNNDGKMENS